MWAVSDLLARADFAIKAGNRDLAFHLYSMIVDQYPNQGEAFYRLSILEIERCSFQHAYMHADLAAQLEPNNPRFKSQKERVKFELARLGQALESDTKASTFYDGRLETPDGFLNLKAVDLPGGVPDRVKIGGPTVYGLGVEPEDYGSAIGDFMRRHPEYGDRCSICVLSKDAVGFADKLRRDIGAQVEVVFIDEANWSFEIAPKVLRLDDAGQTTSRVMFVHLEQQNDVFHIPAYIAVKTQFLVNSHLDAMVILNRTLPTKRLSDAVNPYACIFVAGPFSGTERFVNGLYYLARKAGRAAEVRPDLTLRRHMITHELGENRQPNTPYPRSWVPPEVVPQTEEFLRDLEFFSMGTLREIYPIQFMEAVPYLDIVGIIRDPRDVVMSYANTTIRIYPHQFPEPEGAANPEVLARAAAPFIERHFADICDHFVRMSNSQRCFTVRFESMQDDAMMVFARVLKWLDWGYRYKVDDIAHAAYLGTFFHQSGGTRRRGDGKEITQGATSHLWSGTSRKWERLPKSIRDLMKERGGSKLIELGYATDMDW